MKVLALDFGSARTGVAVSDPTGAVARPLGVVERATTDAGFAKLLAVIAAEEPEQRMWDSELVEFLLAALSPTHETRTFCSRCGYVTSAGEIHAGPEMGQSLHRHEHEEA